MSLNAGIGAAKGSSEAPSRASVTRRRRGLRRSIGLGAISAVFIACGSRTGLDHGPPQIAPECLVDEDCPTYGDLCKPVFCVPYAEFGDAGANGGSGGSGGGSGGSGEVALRPKKGGKCVQQAPVVCEDNDVCTKDSCDPDTGDCHYTYATLDSDGDGYRAPRVGTLPGAPDACGNDCNDTNAKAHPGGIEVCDGVDNDCNGVVDDNATYIPLANDAVRVDGDLAPASPGGIAWSGKSYATTYTGSTKGDFRVFGSVLDPTGKKLPPGEVPVTFKNADASGGPLVWTGDRFGLAWQDRRNSDYEIYFAILGEDGAKKFHGDVQLTSADGFSVNPAITWNGDEFLVIWQDDRNGAFDIFAQRVDHDSVPIGANIQLTTSMGLGNESPTVAAGAKTVGLAWSHGDALSHIIQFQAFSPDLTMPIGAPLLLTNGKSDAVYPTVIWNKDRYVVAWYDRTANPKAIYAAVVSEDGEFMVKPRPISSPGQFRSRYPFLRPLGDRLLAVYADDRDQNDGYELYSRMLSNTLDSIGSERRLTNAKRDSIQPVAAFGPDGNVGILFRDDRDAGEHHVWFTRLGCVAGK
jgi:Putative metal-binding motif